LPPSVSKTHPTLIVIGGREDKIGDALILREVARHVGNGKLVVTDVASSDPDGLFEEYDEVFRKIGVQDVQNLEIRSREDASNPKVVRVLDDANAVFFTGGDQLKITSQIGGTPVFDRILDIYRNGGVIAGTSAARRSCAARCSPLVRARLHRALASWCRWRPVSGLSGT
jgi:cyanophycinase